MSLSLSPTFSFFLFYFLSFYSPTCLSCFSIFFIFRLIDLEAAASTSSLHLLWTIQGREREALGSKCLAGLNVTSCYPNIQKIESDDCYDSARNGNDHDYYYNNNDNSNSNNNNDNNNNNNKNENNDNNYDSSRNDSSKLKIYTNEEEHILVLSRPFRKELGPGSDQLVKGDRVLISLERDENKNRNRNKKRKQDSDPTKRFLKNTENSDNKKYLNIDKNDLERNLSRNVLQCNDIEDFHRDSSSMPRTFASAVGAEVEVEVEVESDYYQSNRKSNRADDEVKEKIAQCTSHNTTHSTGLTFIEPNVAVGQILKITETEVHITLRARPKRLFR